MARNQRQPSLELVEEFNRLVRTRQRLSAERSSVAAEYDARKDELLKEFEPRMLANVAAISEADAAISNFIGDHKKELLVSGKRSFVTAVATARLRNQPGRRKVANWKGVMQAARELGVVRKIAKLSMVWKGVEDKFFSHFDSHPEHRAEFEPYIETIDDSELLMVAPNSGHTVVYDGERISPEPFTIKLSKS